MKGSKDSNPRGMQTMGPIVWTQRRDMGTQMSPDSSTCSSPKRRTLAGSYPHPPRTKLEEAGDPERIEISNLVSWSKRHAAWFKRRNHQHSKDDDSSYDAFTAEVRASLPVEIREEREEAKITAWENLQKAKAEAAIRKLEVKLEKTRLSSMDRILKKLRRAELNAQEMRRRRSAAEDRPRYHGGNTDKQRTERKHLSRNILLLHCFCRHRF
ncbi:hypothetical protein SAY87_022654 [Trapa incisa]|uniref:Remorin C-terminal domain-containing protein n=1 Tax=Trapa incisa TaxID=236973 RepID=A0AAN7K199_9MYRT|nr:hypothetical protein SAY87_022654 [Trapa incisa]